jgi:hypothetical protein
MREKKGGKKGSGTDWAGPRRKKMWTTGEVRVLKRLARKKASAGKIARKLKRTTGATRQKAFSLGLSLKSKKE